MNGSAPRSKILHLAKFDGGRSTPQEYHQAHAFAPTVKCPCGRRPVAVARVMMPLAELRKRDSAFDALCEADPNAIMKMIVMLQGTIEQEPYVRISSAHACAQCLPTMEKVLAKNSPSWCVVDIQRGPDPTNKVALAAT